MGAFSRQFDPEVTLTLHEHDIAGDVLPTLTEADLASLGVSKFGPRRRLSIAITDLVNGREDPIRETSSGRKQKIAGVSGANPELHERKNTGDDEARPSEASVWGL